MIILRLKLYTKKVFLKNYRQAKGIEESDTDYRKSEVRILIDRRNLFYGELK
jgi:hypothetical protein